MEKDEEVEVTQISTVVTFRDSQGDLFPVRVWALAPPRSAVLKLAEKELLRIAEEEEWKPVLPVEVVKYEEV